MLSVLRSSFWITRITKLVTSVYQRCTTCARFDSRICQQQMGPLPAVRLTPARPFTSTGLDYAGPISVLFSKGRGAKSTKGYVSIFICMVTRAIHIEIVSDLTVDAFLAAYSRFCARRGVCSTLYSDNATTFKGAASELNNLFKKSTSFTEKVVDRLAAQGTKWIFIPPRAPHFDGLWEAAIRSFKHHFKRVIGDSTLTFEELSTLAAKIEACLNSRPLCPINGETSVPAALTPAHFLVDSSLLSFPEPLDSNEKPVRLLNRWKLLNNLRDSFWSRWKKEVLHHLQQRNKWQKIHNNLQKGDIVLFTRVFA